MRAWVCRARFAADRVFAIDRMKKSRHGTRLVRNVNRNCECGELVGRKPGTVSAVAAITVERACRSGLLWRTSQPDRLEPSARSIYRVIGCQAKSRRMTLDTPRPVSRRRN